jgi:hypothetical protein
MVTAFCKGNLTIICRRQSAGTAWQPSRFAAGLEWPSIWWPADKAAAVKIR